MRSLRRTAVISGLLLGWALIFAAPAGAHTGFESSDPADGATVDQPVGQVTITFSGPAEPAGDGFQVLDGSGEVRTPSSSTSEGDGAVWKLQFDPPLSGGDIGVRWSVKAPDAHPIDGSFAFSAPALEPEAPASEPVTETTVAPVDGTTEPTAPAADEAEVAQSSQLEDFLESDGQSTTAAQRLADFGRIVGVLGVLIGLGALAFAAWVLRGERTDIALVLSWVRRGGIAIMLGAVIEIAAQANLEATGVWGDTLTGSSLGAALTSSFGIAALLRIAGGGALLIGTRMITSPVRGSEVDSVSVVGVQRELVSAGTDQGALPDGPSAQAAASADRAWQPIPGSSIALTGVALVLSAHVFAGHTVTEGFRLLTGLLDIVHVAAGAVWAGGLVMLIAVSWNRYQDDRDLRTEELAIRFSVVAATALAAVTIAGVVMAVIILDSVSELWSTPWGRLLVAKVLVAGAAISAGAYNHRFLVPEMTANPGDESLIARFRSVVAIESVLLLIVGIVTAFLIGASSS